MAGRGSDGEQGAAKAPFFSASEPEGRNTRERFLVLAFGSLGDVQPCITLAHLLARRGHEVTVATFPHYRELVTGLGLRFAPLGPASLWDDFRNHGKAWDTAYGLRYYFQEVIGPMVEPVCQVTLDAVATDPRLVVVASVLALGARIASDARPFRLVTVNPYPVFFQSRRRPPVLPRSKMYDVAKGRVPLVPHGLVNALCDVVLGPPERNPRIVLSRHAAPWKKWLQQALSNRLLDAMLRPHIEGLGRRLGCPVTVRRVFEKYAFSPELTLGLFPDWFAPRQDDWPPNVVLATFPELGDRRAPPSRALQDFLAAGPPPVVFTFGSHKQNSLALFQNALEAVLLTGHRAVFVTANDRDIPRDLPAQVLHTRFEPLPHLLRRAVLAVHHAGIGTTADALRAAVPQILVPFTYDQPDNATRLVRLGVGRILPQGLMTPRSLAEAIEAMAGSPQVGQACQALAARLAAEDGDGLIAGTLLDWVARTEAPRAFGPHL